MSYALFEPFFRDIAQSPLSHWLESAPAQLSEWLKNDLHGGFNKWLRVLDQLPDLPVNDLDLISSVSVGSVQSSSESDRQAIVGLLKKLMPWRKGPFSIHGVEIDTEWRSDMKWDRLLPHLSPLKDRYILDVGCGSGYHMWRMLGEDAKGVFGIDPSQLFLIQFLAIKHFIQPQRPVHLLPLGIQQLPALNAFDTVFSMGVLYHRRSPMDHLSQLHDQLRTGGELVLETLVVEGDEHTVLVPNDRYAQMRNVWFIPSTQALEGWLKKTGFVSVRTVDVNDTGLEEQRKTDWMQSESLDQFLDPNDPTRTIEGYPAPKRAILIAEKK